MKTSAQAMKSTIKESDLDKAEDLMDDIQEAMDQVQEMNDAMSQPIGPVMDDDELEAELAELEQMDADDLLTTMSDPPATLSSAAQDNSAVIPDMPNVPDNKPKGIMYILYNMLYI